MEMRLQVVLDWHPSAPPYEEIARQFPGASVRKTGPVLNGNGPEVTVTAGAPDMEAILSLWSKDPETVARVLEGAIRL